MSETHWRQKNHWGDNFWIWHIDHPYYSFWLYRDSLLKPIPKVGDEILWPEEEGLAHMIVGEVDWQRDPHDMYHIKAWMIGKMVVPEKKLEVA